MDQSGPSFGTPKKLVLALQISLDWNFLFSSEIVPHGYLFLMALSHSTPLSRLRDMPDLDVWYKYRAEYVSLSIAVAAAGVWAPTRVPERTVENFLVPCDVYSA